MCWFSQKKKRKKEVSMCWYLLLIQLNIELWLILNLVSIYYLKFVMISGGATQRSGCSQEHPDLKLFFLYNNLIFFICLPLKKNRNTHQSYQEYPQNFCLHKSFDASHNFNPCLLQPSVDDQGAMSLTVLVSLLSTLISFCHLLVEDLKSIYLFGKSGFHFLA